MAANEKPVFATAAISGEGNRLPYQPGERIDGRMRPDVVKGLMERGLATDSPAQQKAAQEAESARREDVERQIETRSEKRESSRRAKGDE